MIAVEGARGVTQAVTAPIAQGSLADRGLKIMKWVAIILLIAVLALIVWFVIQIAEYDFSISAWAEAEYDVSDTGDSTGGALLESWIRLSPFGWIGSAAGIGVSGWGSKGLSQNWSKARDSLYTLGKRLGGG